MEGKPLGVRADQVVIVWGFISDPLAAPSRGAILRLDSVDDLNPVDLIRDLEALQRSEGASNEVAASPFILQQRFSHTSWGAEAAVLELLMRAAEPLSYGITSAALFEGLKAIAKKVHKSRKSTRTELPQPSEEDEIRNAIHTVESFYDLPPGQLTAELVSGDSESAVVRVDALSGDSYRVQIVWNEHGGVLTRIDPFHDE